MRIEHDGLVFCEANAYIDHNGEIQIEDILVNGEKPDDTVRKLAHEILLASNEERIWQNQPTDEEIRSAIEDDRFHSWYESKNCRRAI
ncbi:MAG: hypothetical protein M0Q43_10350 [Methanothrix sp.]|jgi:hypothetical protein|nr:hypothetical protein [Methanothrix sp.]